MKQIEEERNLSKLIIIYYQFLQQTHADFQNHERITWTRGARARKTRQ